MKRSTKFGVSAVIALVTLVGSFEVMAARPVRNSPAIATLAQNLGITIGTPTRVQATITAIRDNAALSTR